MSLSEMGGVEGALEGKSCWMLGGASSSYFAGVMRNITRWMVRWLSVIGRRISYIACFQEHFERWSFRYLDIHNWSELW